jgi:hypothetical protein
MLVPLLRDRCCRGSSRLGWIWITTTLLAMSTLVLLVVVGFNRQTALEGALREWRVRYAELKARTDQAAARPPAAAPRETVCLSRIAPPR